MPMRKETILSTRHVVKRGPWHCGCNKLGTRVAGPKESTYPLMSESGAKYSWDGSSDDLKDALIGFMAVNDLAETLFTSVTAQPQVFGRIGMDSTNAISGMDKNGFSDQRNKKK